MSPGDNNKSTEGYFRGIDLGGRASIAGDGSACQRMSSRRSWHVRRWSHVGRMRLDSVLRSSDGHLAFCGRGIRPNCPELEG